MIRINLDKKCLLSSLLSIIIIFHLLAGIDLVYSADIFSADYSLNYLIVLEKPNLNHNHKYTMLNYYRGSIIQRNVIGNLSPLIATLYLYNKNNTVSGVAFAVEDKKDNILRIITYEDNSGIGEIDIKLNITFGSGYFPLAIIKQKNDSICIFYEMQFQSEYSTLYVYDAFLDNMSLYKDLGKVGIVKPYIGIGNDSSNVILGIVQNSTRGLTYTYYTIDTINHDIKQYMSLNLGLTNVESAIQYEKWVFVNINSSLRIYEIKYNVSTLKLSLNFSPYTQHIDNLFKIIKNDTENINLVIGPYNRHTYKILTIRDSNIYMDSLSTNLSFPLYMEYDNKYNNISIIGDLGQYYYRLYYNGRKYTIEPVISTYMNSYTYLIDNLLVYSYNFINLSSPMYVSGINILDLYNGDKNAILKDEDQIIAYLKVRKFNNSNIILINYLALHPKLNMVLVEYGYYKIYIRQNIAPLSENPYTASILLIIYLAISIAKRKRGGH